MWLIFLIAIFKNSVAKWRVATGNLDLYHGGQPPYRPRSPGRQSALTPPTNQLSLNSIFITLTLINSNSNNNKTKYYEQNTTLPTSINFIINSFTKLYNREKHFLTFYFLSFFHFLFALIIL